MAKPEITARAMLGDNAGTRQRFDLIGAEPVTKRGVFVAARNSSVIALRQAPVASPWNVARPVGHAIEPGPDRRITAEFEIGLVSDVGIGIERDVGDREVVRDEIAVAHEVCFHHAERAIAIFRPVLERVALQFAARP